MPPEVDFEFGDSLFDDRNVIGFSENAKCEHKDWVFRIDCLDSVIAALISKYDVIAKIISHFKELTRKRMSSQDLFENIGDFSTEKMRKFNGVAGGRCLILFTFVCRLTLGKIGVSL